MPEKDGDEGKSTKSVVNKKQKQMMGEEGYDIARDMGRVRPSKDKKDATTMPPSKEMEKTRKVNKGPSALERVKKKYKGQIMDVKKEELDLTQVAEAFGGYIIEKNDPRSKEEGERILKKIKDFTNKQGELPIDFSKTGKEDPVKGVKSPRDIIGNKKKQGRPFGSKNKPKETDPLKQLTLDDIKKERAPRKGVDYFFDPDKAKADREKLISKRKEYGIDRKGNMSDAGAERYARKTKQLSSGSNIPVKITQADKDLAKRRAVGGDKITDKSGKIIGTTTGKYGGNLPRKRPSNAKSLEQIKKEIDSRPPDGRTTRTKVKTPSYKRIETKVTDKEIQDLIKQGRQTKPTKTKRITAGAVSKRDKAIKDIDDLIIEPKKGEAAATEKVFKKQKRFYQQQQQQQPQSGPRTTTRTRTRTNTRTPIGDKSYDDLKKEIEKIKKNLKNPVDKSFGDALKKNQTGFVQPKIKPITKTITPLKAITKTKPASRFGRVMKALRKNPKTAAAALAIGTGVYLYNQGKKTAFKALLEFF